MTKINLWDFLKFDSPNLFYYFAFIAKKFKYAIKNIIFKRKYHYIFSIVIRLFFLQLTVKIKNVFKYK